MKFTIRDVLLATALVAVALGWGIDRARRASSLPTMPLTETPEVGRGRYEVVVTGKDHDKLYLLDTRTGELRERYSDGYWHIHCELGGEVTGGSRNPLTPDRSPTRGEGNRLGDSAAD